MELDVGGYAEHSSCMIAVSMERLRLSTAALRSGEYPTSSSYSAHLRNRGKVEQRTTSLTQGVSNDNPFSAALFRTCKYRPNWPTKGFATKEDAQAWVKSFPSWYNDEHLHSAIRFVTPNKRHAGHDRGTLANRAILYANARAQNPERWSGKIRNWKRAGPVWLNPEAEISAPEIRGAA